MQNFGISLGTRSYLDHTIQTRQEYIFPERFLDHELMNCPMICEQAIPLPLPRRTFRVPIIASE